MTTSCNPYRGFRFPSEVIQHAVWLYHCLSLSLRDVATSLAACGVVVSYESIREWGMRFGRLFANRLKRRRPRPGDNWLLDEVFIRICGKLHYLWRAVDQDGHVLDILVQSRRSAIAQRSPGGMSAKLTGSQALLPQAAEGPAVCPICDRDRQAQEPRRCEARDPAGRGAPAKPLSQQPGRGVAPADPATRPTDAAVQVGASRPAVPVRPRPHSQPLPAPPPSPHRRPEPLRT